MLRPLNDWLVVDPEAKPTQQGSIIIPDSVAGDKVPYRGTVIAAGPGRLREGAATVLKPDLTPMLCKVGDFIIFNRYTTAEVEYGGKKYLAVRDQDVFIVVEPEPSTELPPVELTLKSFPDPARPTQDPKTAEDN